MFEKKPIYGLLFTALSFLLLWFIVPKAGFMAYLTESSLHTQARGIGIIFPGIVYGLSASLPMLLFMAVDIAAVYYYARLNLKWQIHLLVLFISLLVIFISLTFVIIHSHIPAMLGRYPNLREHFLILGRLPGIMRLAVILLFISAASALGGAVSYRVTDKNLLLPVSMFAACIDFWTVNFGVVNRTIQTAPEIVTAVSAPIPHAGTGFFIPNTMIGPGDFLFLALIFSAITRLKMDNPRNFWFIFCTMSIGMMAVVFDILPFLPALTVLGIGVVAANYKEFKLSKQEKISIVIVGAVLAISIPLVQSLLSPKDNTEPVKQTAPITSKDQKR